MFNGCINNLIRRLLNSNVDYLVSVIGKNNIDQVLSDVVNVALYCCEQHAAATTITGLLHMWL